MIIMGTTLTTFAMDTPDIWGAWLSNFEQVRRAAGQDVRPFVAIETDARGIGPFDPLLDVIEHHGGAHWSFHLDDGRTTVTTDNRLRHIVTGQNLVATYCTERLDVSHLLFMAADTQAPDDVIPRLLETGHPYIGPRIDTYGAVCRGPAIGIPKHRRPGDRPWQPYPTEWQVEDAMPSAACILLAREVFTRLRWRVEAPNSDDPCYQLDARDLLGIRSAVRADIRARHFPEAIGPIEGRPHDLRVER